MRPPRTISKEEQQRDRDEQVLCDYGHVDPDVAKALLKMRDLVATYPKGRSSLGPNQRNWHKGGMESRLRVDLFHVETGIREALGYEAPFTDECNNQRAVSELRRLVEAQNRIMARQDAGEEVTS